MKRSNRLVLLIGVFLAIVAFVGIVVVFQGDRGGGGGTQTPSQLPTVFAARAIALGTPITADMLTSKNLAVTQRDAQAFPDASLLLGKIARQDIAAGKQLTARDFDTGASTGLINVTVPPGQRAIAIQVDQVSGVGTVIRQGDYVDLLVGFGTDKFPVVTLNPSDDTINVVSGINATSVKLLLQGMQVIGTLLPPRETTEGQTQGEQGVTLTGQQEIVILSVTPQQAEVIKFAQMDGTVSLVLRSPNDFRDEQGNVIPGEAAGTTGVTLRVLVDEYDVLIPQLVEAILPERQ
ncbi:MAG TPA: Flp pilus assembly protein CpaB [Candidatus Limnocylindrales bacterium]